MELPIDVMVHNPILGVKGGKGILLRICPEGFYELVLSFGDRRHRTLLPIPQTVLILTEGEEEEIEGEFEIER